MIVAIVDANVRERFGGKAAQLAAAIAAGLPVPDGWALSWQAARDVAHARRAPPSVAAGTWAVRSSAADEDGSLASFAGQHATRLHVAAADVAEAIREVVASGDSPAASAYRTRLGLDPRARMGVVVQRMVPSVSAGVLFTRHPTTGADEIVVEAAWGLGEAVVAGLVVPDHWRLARDGSVLHARAGTKDVEIVHGPSGGTTERPVDEHRVRAPCLSTEALRRLAELAARLDDAFEGPHDAEFAFDADGRLYLLQRRALTR